MSTREGGRSVQHDAKPKGNKSTKRRGKEKKNNSVGSTLIQYFNFDWMAGINSAHVNPQNIRIPAYQVPTQPKAKIVGKIKAYTTENG